MILEALERGIFSARFLRIFRVHYFCFIVLNLAMILVPTRELALQTSPVRKELSKYLNIQVMVTTGGTSLRDDIMWMWLHQPVHMLVGTLGRILDLTKKGVCVLKDCTMLVMYSAIFLVTVKIFKDRHLRKPYVINFMDVI
ncbi:hypothetical protein Bca4012_063863 [Brassica carinata]